MLEIGNYKLYYFPSKGRDQPIRLLLNIAGIDFDDIKVTGEEWEISKQVRCTIE